jgi:integrase
VPLPKLTPSQLQAFYSQKLTEGRQVGQAGGLSPGIVRYLHAIIREALHQAVKWQMIGRNVADATEPPRAARPQVRAWDQGQVRTFLAAAEGDHYGPVWLLALMTGLRRGELLGLRWEELGPCACPTRVGASSLASRSKRSTRPLLVRIPMPRSRVHTFR